MNLSELDYKFPEELIATEPESASRVLLNRDGVNSELSLEGLLEEFLPGDLLVLNDSKVVKKRIFAAIDSKPYKQLEVLFVEPLGDKRWTVLFPASRLKDGDRLVLPGGIHGKLVTRGIPQTLELDQEIDFPYFARNGELPLPPYIQKARGERHQTAGDDEWYQTAWADKEGSAAAPTASLHFKATHLEALEQKGVGIKKLTLHVGLGTFLPIQSDKLEEHVMHKEWIHIPPECVKAIAKTKARGGRVWALGTTVARSLESMAKAKIDKQPDGSFQGESDLFIYDDYVYELVDVLMTNFHQPKTSLMALVGAFTSLANVRSAYEWAIEKRFRLFSYGDLSVWMKK